MRRRTASSSLLVLFGMNAESGELSATVPLGSLLTMLENRVRDDMAPEPPPERAQGNPRCGFSNGPSNGRTPRMCKSQDPRVPTRNITFDHSWDAHTGNDVVGSELQYVRQSHRLARMRPVAATPSKYPEFTAGDYILIPPRGLRRPILSLGIACGGPQPHALLRQCGM